MTLTLQLNSIISYHINYSFSSIFRLFFIFYLKFSFYELTGALQGFNYYLVTCAPSKSEEPQICQRIYVCVKKLSDPGDITRRSAFRS